jgi:hypothetical protein
MKGKEKKKKTADNKRFHASGGVCPQKHLWEFGSLSPARTFVKPPPAQSCRDVSSNAGATVQT